MKCPHCGTQVFSYTPSPTWRHTKNQMPPHGVDVETYSDSKRRWGRAEWNGLKWKVLSGPAEIDWWYDETPSQGDSAK